MATKNIEVVHTWQMGLTGDVANISSVLKRYPNSTTETSASETVVIVEIGATGTYYVTYTPTNAQVYRLKLSSSTNFREAWFEDSVSDTPATTTATDSYASESDVVTYAQMGDYTSSTVPTETQVLVMLADRASEIYARLSTIMGSDVTGPPSYSQAIDSSTDAGAALARATRRANAIGAAIDAVYAAGAGDSPGASARMDILITMYDLAVVSLIDPATAYLGYPSRSETHLTAGDVTVPARIVSSQQGLIFDANTEF